MKKRNGMGFFLFLLEYGLNGMIFGDIEKQWTVIVRQKDEMFHFVWTPKINGMLFGKR